MKKIILPENLNDFVAMLQNFWGEYSFENTEFTIAVNKDILDDINKKLYYNTKTIGEPEATDEIVINLNGYKFIYKLEE